MDVERLIGLIHERAATEKLAADANMAVHLIAIKFPIALGGTASPAFRLLPHWDRQTHRGHTAATASECPSNPNPITVVAREIQKFVTADARLPRIPNPASITSPKVFTTH